MAQPVDSSILHEIVRIIEARRKVPGRVRVRSKEYQITYLEDHQRRLEETLLRYDADRLNMLYGQLASKIKYQVCRHQPARARAGAATRSRGRERVAAPARRKAAPAKKRAASTKRKPVIKAKPAAGKKAVRLAKRKSAGKRPAAAKARAQAKKRK